MQISRATIEHLEPWAQLRAALWPQLAPADHRRELAEALQAKAEATAGFVAQDASGDIVGFAEAALRSDYVNGCKTSPVAFLEGVYVRPEHRRRGIAELLCRAVEDWGRAAGCREFAADALLDNAASQVFLKAAGLDETERVVFFRKPL